MSTMKTVALSLLLLAPGFALAQSAPEGAEPSEAPPSVAAPEIEQDEAPANQDETPEERLDRLFGALANTEGDAADRIADEITAVWARSGSPSMDLLLARARKATNDEDYHRQIRSYLCWFPNEYSRDSS